MHTIGTIISFEVSRTLRRRSFWLTTLLLPILIVVIGLIVAAANQSSQQATTQTASYAFEYTDPAGLIDPALAAQAKGTKIQDAATGVADVTSGRVQAFFAYPANPTASPTQLYGQDLGILSSGKYAATAQALLTQSAENRINDPMSVGIVTGKVNIQTTTFKDGQATNDLGALIVPMLLAIIFFMLVVLLGNQALAAFVEEKENRVAETTLTATSASSLLVGKIVSLLILGFIQMIVLAIVPVASMFAGTSTPLGALWATVGTITVDPVTTTLGVLLLLGAFALNMTSVVTVGMIMPNQRDASTLFAPIMLLTVLPLYLSPMMATSPDSTVVQIVTFFPWSAGITSLMRNALGTLPVAQAVIVIVEQFVFAAIVLWFANKIARFGLISYDKALDVRSVLKRTKVA